MASTISSNMNLVIPTVGQEPGPTWAEDLNSSLNIIDVHDHSSGSGVQITPSGLNINSDLSFTSNNATQLRSSRYSAQNSPLALGTDLNCTYVSGVDLYYNDGLGNQVRITQSGGVAGTPGSIANLTSPASASYVSGTQTFVWQSDSNTAANMDAGSLLLRNLTASSFALTLNPPNAMGANYSITLPSLPVSTKMLTMTSAGVISANYDTDNVTLEVSSNNLQVKDSGISTDKIADGAVTPIKMSAMNFALSSSCGNFTTTSSSFTTVTNLSTSLTIAGNRPIMISLVSDGSGNQASVYGTDAGSSFQMQTRFLLDGSPISYMDYGGYSAIVLPPSAFQAPFLNASAGSHTFAFQVRNLGSQIQVNRIRLFVYEM